ncbi:MAG: response regulator [Myxococcales bacterium]|nr:response regulator [Myxococcales bacterium]
MSASILVIDDDRMTRVLLKRRLERDGYEVALAESGARGLELARAAPYSLILLDLVMPGTSGLDVLRAFQVDGVRSPVVMLSAEGGESHVDECLRLGARGYLQKPVMARDLAEMIDQVLGAAGG